MRKFAKAIAAAVPRGIPVVSTRRPVEGRGVLFTDLANAEVSPAVEEAHRRVGPDTVAKILFTSGSTGSPKGVINTQRMLCANQAMIRDCYRFLEDEPPVVLDWAPWSHTAGGNKVFNMVLYNGGTFHIDDGRPTPELIGRTARNLADVAPTWYFNVPKGYEELVPRLEADDALCRRFFSRLNLMMYAGAGLAQHTWSALERLAVKATGERVILATGLGSTETAPFSLMCTTDNRIAGNIGLPARGLTLKLVPVEGKLEARLKGPNITPGYWREPELTAAAFDEEGFYRLGDAFRFADPGDASKGFYFDGRIAENFKLNTGTWVSVGALRARFIDHFGEIVRDVVIAGLDRDRIGALVFPDIPTCRAVAGFSEGASVEDLLADMRVRGFFAEKLASFARVSTGSSNRVERLLLLAEPPSIDRGEATDKGSINQRAVLGVALRSRGRALFGFRARDCASELAPTLPLTWAACAARRRGAPFPRSDMGFRPSRRPALRTHQARQDGLEKGSTQRAPAAPPPAALEEGAFERVPALWRARECRSGPIHARPEG